MLELGLSAQMGSLDPIQQNENSKNRFLELKLSLYIIIKKIKFSLSPLKNDWNE